MIPSEKDRKFTQAMAAAFFDLSPDGFRKKEARGDFVNVEGEDLSLIRGDTTNIKTDNGGYKHRKYSLYDIRRIAHALRTNGKISNRQLRIIIMRIDSFAEPLKIRNRKNLYKRYKG